MYYLEAAREAKSLSSWKPLNGFHGTCGGWEIVAN